MRPVKANKRMRQLIYYDGYGTSVVMPTERRQKYDK